MAVGNGIPLHVPFMSETITSTRNIITYSLAVNTVCIGRNTLDANMVVEKKKDLEDIQGLISVDRSSKATQPLTIPRPIQVVCKGSSPRNRQVW